MMTRRITVWCGTAIAMLGTVLAATPQSSTGGAASAAEVRVALNRFCVTCHNERLKTAGLLLDKSDVDHVSTDAAIWEKVVRKLRTQAMPPAGAPRPDKATYDSVADYLEAELDGAAVAKPNPGRPAVHRLNRAEYTNAIRDLLSLDISGEELLPADDSGYGFDNIGDVLTVSSTLLDRYLLAAEKISDLAIGNASAGPTPRKYDVPRRLVQEDRVSEDLPLDSRGGIAVHHFFPLDGEYAIKLRMRRNRNGEILGLGQPQQIYLDVDGKRIKQFAFGDDPRGKDLRSEGRRENNYDYRTKADAVLEVRVPVKAGVRLVGVSFLKETSLKDEGLLRLPLSGRGLDSVTIDGPFGAVGPGDTPSRRKIFLCRPSGANDEESCARKILSTLSRFAYRRPVNHEDVDPLVDLYKKGRSQGSFDAGIGMAIQAMLVSPDFLFRYEPGPSNLAPGAVYRLSDIELASRLSFFLWSSIPDGALLDLAAAGRLKNPEVLKQQVLRMLGDSRSNALVSNFAGQWLYLRNMSLVTPDPTAFPDFDDNLREAFQKETELFFESIVHEDRNVLDLLNANYTFLNERLARHYGIPNVYGNEFRRVTLNDENRWGLLGKGSILTVTSYPSRTAPTLRGKWLLENILGSPPPPPPPNVPSLKENSETKVLTMRQRMEQHRANPACASCHARMDPLGFALENFDATGTWRTTSGLARTPIDPSGQLPDGTKFNGPAELRRILMSRSEQFVTTVTEKLLTYALGRGVEYYDQPTVRKIVRESATGNYRWSSIVLGIVNSTPFQMSVKKPAEPTVTASRR